MDLVLRFGEDVVTRAREVLNGTRSRVPGDGLGDVISHLTGLCCEDESLTDQSQAADADINVIVARVLAGQTLPEVRMPQYGDFSGIGDYRSAVTAVREMEEDFMKLPAHVRARFENDPQQFLEFFADEKNTDEAVALGIAFKKVPTPEFIQKVQIVGEKPAT